MYKDIAERLERAGINASFQRIKIMEHLLKQKGHPTADHLYIELLKEVPTLSKATVYNTLNLLTDKGLINALTNSHSGTYYDAILERHGHFICQRCGEIYDFACESCGQNFKLEGFQVQSEETVLRGICKHCSEKSQRPLEEAH